MSVARFECIIVINVQSNIVLHGFCFISLVLPKYGNCSDTIIRKSTTGYMHFLQVAALNAGSLIARTVATTGFSLTATAFDAHVS